MGEIGGGFFGIEALYIRGFCDQAADVRGMDGCTREAISNV